MRPLEVTKFVAGVFHGKFFVFAFALFRYSSHVFIRLFIVGGLPGPRPVALGPRPLAQGLEAQLTSQLTGQLTG